MTQWIKIAEIGDVPAGAGRAFEVEGNSIAVFNVDGRLYAIEMGDCTRLTTIARTKARRLQWAALRGALLLADRME